MSKLMIGIPILNLGLGNYKVIRTACKCADRVVILNNKKNSSDKFDEIYALKLQQEFNNLSVYTAEGINKGMLYIRSYLHEIFLQSDCTHFMAVDSDDDHWYERSKLDKIIDNLGDLSFAKLNYLYQSRSTGKKFKVYGKYQEFHPKFDNWKDLQYVNGVDLTIIPKELMKNYMEVLHREYGSLDSIPYLRVAEDALETIILLNLCISVIISDYVAGQYLIQNSSTNKNASPNQLINEFEISLTTAFSLIYRYNHIIPIEYLNLLKTKSYSFIYAELFNIFSQIYPDITHKVEVTND